MSASRRTAPAGGDSAPRRGPVAAGDLLKDLLKDVGSRSQRARYTDALRAAVGERLAEHVEVSGFRRGRLYVTVDSSPLYAELSGFRAEELRVACNEHLEDAPIAEIVFRMGGTGHA